MLLNFKESSKCPYYSLWFSFQAFHGQAVQNRVRRIGSMSKSSSANSDLSEGARSRQVPTIGRGSDPCRICAKTVFILERLNVGGRILHRTCFKCARYIQLHENFLPLSGFRPFFWSLKHKVNCNDKTLIVYIFVRQSYSFSRLSRNKQFYPSHDTTILLLTRLLCFYFPSFVYIPCCFSYLSMKWHGRGGGGRYCLLSILSSKLKNRCKFCTPERYLPVPLPWICIRFILFLNHWIFVGFSRILGAEDLKNIFLWFTIRRQPLMWLMAPSGFRISGARPSWAWRAITRRRAGSTAASSALTRSSPGPPPSGTGIYVISRRRVVFHYRIAIGGTFERTYYPGTTWMVLLKGPSHEIRSACNRSRRDIRGNIGGFVSFRNAKWDTSHPPFTLRASPPTIGLQYILPLSNKEKVKNGLWLVDWFYKLEIVEVLSWPV